MAIKAAGLYLDYSKNRVTDETLKLLVQLAEESGLRVRIDAMFSGEKINITEKRAVLHIALRAPKNASILVDGKNVVPEVHGVLDKMADFSGRVRSGVWKGHTGKRIRNVVKIGIDPEVILNMDASVGNAAQLIESASFQEAFRNQHGPVTPDSFFANGTVIDGIFARVFAPTPAWASTAGLTSLPEAMYRCASWRVSSH